MLFLSYLSVFFLIASLLVHIITFFGINIAGSFPAILALHLGIFIIGFPSYFMEPFASSSRSPTGWHNLMLPIPQKGKTILKWYPWYLGLNFIVAVLFTFEPNETLTQNNEGWAQVFNLHLFSAFWIYFYLFFTLVFWYHNERKEKIARKKHHE